jgi:hypothetical protein
MNKDDCQVEFYFSFEKCDGFGGSESRFKKWAEKIGFPSFVGRQDMKNAKLPSARIEGNLREIGDVLRDEELGWAEPAASDVARYNGKSSIRQTNFDCARMRIP